MTPEPLRLEFGAPAWDAWKTGGALLLLIAMMIVAVLAKVDIEQNAHRHALEELRASLSPKTPDRTARSDPATQKALKAAADVLDRLTVRWDDLFVMIEGAGSKELGLLSLVPDPRNGTLRITGQAKSLDDVLGYVARLGQQPMLSEVSLLSYQTSPHEGADVVEFVVVARWK